MPVVRERDVREEVVIDETDIGETVFEDSESGDLEDELGFDGMFDDDDDEIDTTIPDEILDEDIFDDEEDI